MSSLRACRGDKNGENIVENRGKPWKTIENRGKSWKTMENHRKSWKTIENK